MTKRCGMVHGMLNTMHFGTESKDITVDELMNGHLVTFIELAGISTNELIYIWVHPLYLRAMSVASKEDTPNLGQAMNGPFADEYWKAAVTKIETLEGMDA